MEVKAFKLSTGEEIVARVVNTLNDRYVIDQPRVIALMGDPRSGNVQITLMPWMASHQDAGEMTLYRDHVLCEVKPADELEKGYLSNTSGIQLLNG